MKITRRQDTVTITLSMEELERLDSDITDVFYHNQIPGRNFTLGRFAELVRSLRNKA